MATQESPLCRHRRRCLHCNQMLSYSAYRSHSWSLYYIESEERWIQEHDMHMGEASEHADTSHDQLQDLIVFGK